MPTVFNNAMTAHVWAQQEQQEGRSNNGQFYFDGLSLFSYGRHYCAGFCLPMPDGGRVFFVNGDSNSPTTGRHVSYAARAIPGRAFSVPGLTNWAAYLESALYPFDYDKRQEASPRRNLAPGRFPSTMTARRAKLPTIRRMMKEQFPGEQAAAAIFRAFGQPKPEQAAARELRAYEKREQAAAAKAEKAKKDKLANAARYSASRSPRDISRAISQVLGSFASSDIGRDRLESWGRELHREAKEARSRGWTRVADTVQGHRKAVREAVKDADRRAGAAYRNAGRRRSIGRFRDACANVAKAGQTTEGNPARVAAHWARLFNEQAAACADLSRHVPLSVATLERLATIQEAARASAAQWEEKGRAAAYAEEQEARAAWLAGEASRRRLSDNRGGALIRAVRVERDDSGAIVAGTLETSHGASVPLVHALRVFRFLKLCRDAGRGWQSNGKALRVGHFRVDSVAPSGDFVAGCHRINWPEVERLADSLNVATLAAEDTTEKVTA